jgi:enoyl-CoA hydratase/carnithine racemase
MASDKMQAEKDGNIGHLIFNNPERHNAVSLEMWDAAKEILDGFLADDRIRVIVLSGAGGRAFVSGADISKFETERGTQEAIAHYNARVKWIYQDIHRLPKPATCGSARPSPSSACRPPGSVSAIPSTA